MDLGVAGKTFVIAGGSRGLGRAIAEKLVAEGARVVLVAREPEATAAALGHAATPFRGDITDPAMPARLVQSVGDGLGGVLVSHGGPPAGEALSLTDEQWAASFELVLAGPIRLLRALAPRIERGGAILFVTSASVRQPIPNLDSSNVLRPGVAALMNCLSRELAPAVRVNSIAPGRIDTDRVRELDRGNAESSGTSEEELRRRNATAIPLGRYGDPAEFGTVGAFLLSPAASYVNGSHVQVDGGLVLATP